MTGLSSMKSPLGLAGMSRGATGGTSFFGAWMDRYQIYFVTGSAALMVVWLARVARPYGFSRDGVRQAGRTLGRHTLVMGVVYAATLGLSMGVCAQ